MTVFGPSLTRPYFFALTSFVLGLKEVPNLFFLKPNRNQVTWGLPITLSLPPGICCRDGSLAQAAEDCDPRQSFRRFVRMTMAG